MKYKIKQLKRLCKLGNISLFKVLVSSFKFNFLYNKKIYAHTDVQITGVKNISTKRRVLIGLRTANFAPANEKTILNIDGTLNVKGKFSIGKGCKIYVAKDAVLDIGSGGYLNSYTKIVVSHKMSIGDNCAISWDCQFLDEDFHTISYDDGKQKKERNEANNQIRIGNNVWMGCGVKIYKGVYIANGCMIASDAIVKGRFEKENCLIGGHPARVLKENIQWQ